MDHGFLLTRSVITAGVVAIAGATMLAPAGAKVRATVHYKTTNTSHRRTANRKGIADLEHYISDATAGHKCR